MQKQAKTTQYQHNAPKDKSIMPFRTVSKAAEMSNNREKTKNKTKKRTYQHQRRRNFNS